MAITAASRLPAAASPGRPRRALGAIACIAVVVGVVLLTPSSRRQSAPVPGAAATPFAVSGVVVTEGGQLISVMGFTVSDGKITEIDAIVDPDRLRRLDLAVLDA